MDIRRVGRDSVLVAVPDAATALAVFEECRRRGTDVADVVPAAETVLFDGVRDLEALVHDLPSWDLRPASRTGELVEVPTTYDGGDLDDVAALWETTTDEVVATHTGTEFVVAFCGFAPGFPYCTGLPDRLAVPRLDSPRAKVPAGAVGLAGPFTGIYPSTSPGGWRLIGRTDLRLWEPDRDPPATLVPGTRVRFVVA
ncbi:MAG: 5-oxoprolinase subunit PxpB [Nocardioidaceae bacterium]